MLPYHGLKNQGYVPPSPTILRVQKFPAGSWLENGGQGGWDEMPKNKRVEVDALSFHPGQFCEWPQGSAINEEIYRNLKYFLFVTVDIFFI